MTTPNHVDDQIGRHVHIGDWIAYGVGRGHITTALVLNFQIKQGDVWDADKRRWVRGDVLKIQVKSPNNEKASLIEATRKQFVKIEPREEGAEMYTGYAY